MQRERLGSRLGFILLSAGCAIGVGNVWKFPWLVGQYGGGAFVVCYIIFLLILGLPIMTMEFAVGRASQKSPVRAYQALEKTGHQVAYPRLYCIDRQLFADDVLHYGLWLDAVLFLPDGRRPV